MTPTSFSEDSLIEQPSIALLGSMGWGTLDAFHEVPGEGSPLGRQTRGDVVLTARLIPALRKLNPALPEAALLAAVETLTADRSLATPAEANRQVYRLLKDGVSVTFRDERNREVAVRVRVIDWNEPGNNDFLLVSQLWITGSMYTRRTDLVGFVNGLPLVFIELKAAHQSAKSAYDDNLRDYKDTIPQLFWYNAFIILSNGTESRIGSLSAGWEHFHEWKKINSEGERGVISLETMLRGTCEPSRLLDMVENFILFENAKGGLRKILARNHQVLGVNNTFQAVQEVRERRAAGETGAGKLGVFWHTQGSGKSYSMVFFSQKVLRKQSGNWTFLVVTDRQELDTQIYKNFANCEAVTEAEERVRAASGEHLQQLLKEDHRFLFTLIQKFHIERGQVYPKLSDRGDIIVMTDEAHRSQYDTLALNMRNALPHAAFLAFTGTPLMTEGEERTREVFGDYVSIYDFKQSVEDGATVPLYYENRIPELQLTNPNLNRQMADLLDNALLDEAQEVRLEREFRHEYQLITREDRLEKVAADIVNHFVWRGYQGKAMVISIDKATAVRMYNKVRKYWNLELTRLQNERIEDHPDEDDWKFIQQRAKLMQETDMAVVVSQGQNEIADMAAKGLDIKPHRQRMITEDLATKFKDPNDPFRLVFVCAMWMTGFDVENCSTIYLDKPMRNHTLMQTIARANRVYKDKLNGLIVDYIGVFRDLQKALAIYGSGGGSDGGTNPVLDKSQLVIDLRDALVEAETFLRDYHLDLTSLLNAQDFERVHQLGLIVDALKRDEETKKKFIQHSSRVDRLFQAILPDPNANEFSQKRKALVVIAMAIRATMQPGSIDEVLTQMATLLDESVAPKDQGYVIRAPSGLDVKESRPGYASHWVDLSQVDFDALRRKFENGRKHMQADQMKAMIEERLNRLVQANRTRMDFYNEFQEMIREYNEGAKNVDAFFEELVRFARGLSEEEQRCVSENLSEEELAVFDLLTRPDPKLNKAEREQVRAVAHDLLDTLKAEFLVLDWRTRQQTRAQVQREIEIMLDKLPTLYNKEMYDKKCTLVFQHVYDSYYGGGKSVYPNLGSSTK